MDTASTSSKDIQDLLREKNVVLIGDSMLRGLYKDLACILYENDRLLYPNELKFNRHQEKKQPLFGEIIETFFIDRQDSTKNVEKRIVRSTEFKYCIKYIFTSRIWNNQMEENLRYLGYYDVVILSSQIWDLTRYGVDGQQLYLENLETCFKKLKFMGKVVIWVTPPPVNADHRSLHDLLSKINPLSLETAKKYDFFILDLHDKLKNHVDFRANDGIHFNPQGQRLVTQYLIDLLSQVPVQRGENFLYRSPPLKDEYSNQNSLTSTFKFLLSSIKTI